MPERDSLAAAVFDTLVLLGDVDGHLGGLAESELHCISYLSCLMWAYEGKDPNQWGYRFVSTTQAAPYAPSLSKAIYQSAGAGLVRQAGKLLRPTTAGNEFADVRGEHVLYRSRKRYLEAAAATTLMLPMPVISDALSQEPQIKNAVGAVAPRELFSEVGRSLLGPHFAGLVEVLGAPSERALANLDPTVPAIVWLNYLARDLAPEQTRVG